MKKVQVYQARLLNSGNQVLGKHFNLQVEPGTNNIIKTTAFSTLSKVNRLAVDKSMQLYNRMISKDRTCFISITIFSPLSEEQADALNAQRTAIGYSVGGAIGAGISRIPSPYGLSSAIGFAAGTGARKIVLSKMKTRHVGDVLISLAAFVSGGIGPQKSYQSHVIHRSEYER